MIKKSSVIIYSLIFILVASCASLQPDYEMPSFMITDFHALPSEGIAPKFEIGLHIINPNRKALEIIGISYTVNLEGHKILTGVTNNVPVVGAYEENDVKMVATTSLFNSISLLTDLMREQRSSFNYVLDVKMDIVGQHQKIHVQKEGNISLVQ